MLQTTRRQNLQFILMIKSLKKMPEAESYVHRIIHTPIHNMQPYYFCPWGNPIINIEINCSRRNILISIIIMGCPGDKINMAVVSAKWSNCMYSLVGGTLFLWARVCHWDPKILTLYQTLFSCILHSFSRLDTQNPYPIPDLKFSKKLYLHVPLISFPGNDILF